MRVLYLSYSGLLDPLGQSQVLQYLVGLGRRGHRITLITFEKPEEWANRENRENTTRAVESAGLHWIPLTYHRRPRGPATVFDLLSGLVLALYLALRRDIEVVHVRGYVLAPVAAGLKAILGTRFVFDQRSFWPDEQVETGIWRNQSFAHRVAKRFEQWFITSADAVVCLTESAATTIQAYPYMQGRPQRYKVITTCTNLELFRPQLPQDTKVGPPTLGYLGTVGVPYLIDEVFAAWQAAREEWSDVRILLVNRNDHIYIARRAQAAGIPDDRIEVISASHRHVAEQLWRMTAGVIFITPTPCRRSCAPTKLGEFLAAGIPCLANAGVGDLEHILTTERVGIIVQDFSRAAIREGLSRLSELCAEPGIRERCVAAARRYFSLDDGVAAYDALYRDLAREVAAEVPSVPLP